MIAASTREADLVIVGAGLYGLTYAREAAERGLRVVVIEKRSHIGGNAFDYEDPITGIRVHAYGAHLFHTSNEKVWRWATRFTSFTDYEHRVFTRHAGEVFPLPIGLATINQFMRTSMSPMQARAWVAMMRDTDQLSEDGEPANLEQKAISLIGRPLYEAFIRDYTAKQWQTPADQLPASVISRLPVRYNYDTRYFNDTHEGIPVHGYTEWCRNIADHPNIRIHLGMDVLRPRVGDYDMSRLRESSLPVVYTGPLDAYFGHSLGSLGWRTVEFTNTRYDVQDFQGTAVMNEADLEVPHTRSIEFKHFHPERHIAFNHEQTIVATEFSRFATSVDDEPYYPVNSTADRSLLLRYREMAADETRLHDVRFGGRLGTYQYLDMHMAIGAALADSARDLNPV